MFFRLFFEKIKKNNAPKNFVYCMNELLYANIFFKKFGLSEKHTNWKKSSSWF